MLGQVTIVRLGLHWRISNSLHDAFRLHLKVDTWLDHAGISHVEAHVRLQLDRCVACTTISAITRYQLVQLAAHTLLA